MNPKRTTVEQRREQLKVAQTRYRTEHKTEIRNLYLKGTYGITHQDYELMYKSQAGLCKICGGVPAHNEHLHIDHNHETGKIRGLLCTHCNKGLGAFKDSIPSMVAAIRYLEENQ